MPKPKEFVIEQDSVNGLTLTHRCMEFSICSEFDLTESELEFWRAVEDTLNKYFPVVK